jgi:adenine-specific DNA-methyltransferase
MKLYEELEKQLKNEPNFVSDNGELKKWVVINKAQNFDGELIALLLDNAELKATFFVDVKGTLVFNQNLFVQFLEQKNYLNDSYTQYKNKVGLTIGGKYLKQRNEVSLVWPFKDCILEGGQSREEQKREEIFFNETLAQDEITQLFDPKVLTNAKVFDKDGEHAFSGFTRDAELNKKRGLPEDTITDNLIIKGNNLLALHSLKKEFAGKVKLIYIDPPYNTGGDKNIFSYNNTFNHSSWLTFMKNRLVTARDFLSSDGFITIAIDHYELYYLGALADEIFGRENRIAIVTVVHNPKGRNQAKFFSENSEFLLVYAKHIDKAEFNQVGIDQEVLETFNLEDEQGKFRYEPYIRARTVWSRENRPKNWYPIYVSQDLKVITSTKKDGYHELFPKTNSGEFAWKNIKETFDRLNTNNFFKAEKEDDKVILYHKYYEQQVFKNVWTDKKYQSEFHGTNLLKRLIGKNNFSYPKSLFAVIDVLKIISSPGDVVMDFFGGSGTSMHAVLELNEGENVLKRQFILVEQLQEHIDILLKRGIKIIESSTDSFTYLELKKYNQIFIEQIEEAKDLPDRQAGTKALLEIWEQMKAKSFLNYNVDIKKQEDHLEDFKALSLKEQKSHLCELLDKNQLYVNLSSLNDKDFSCTDEEKQVTQDFYQLKTK